MVTNHKGWVIKMGGKKNHVVLLLFGFVLLRGVLPGLYDESLSHHSQFSFLTYIMILNLCVQSKQ